MNSGCGNIDYWLQLAVVMPRCNMRGGDMISSNQMFEIEKLSAKGNLYFELDTKCFNLSLYTSDNEQQIQLEQAYFRAMGNSIKHTHAPRNMLHTLTHTQTESQTEKHTQTFSEFAMLNF